MPEDYTGNEGADALARGWQVMDGGEKWAVNGPNAINRARDYAAQAIDDAYDQVWANSTYDTRILEDGTVQAPAMFIRTSPAGGFWVKEPTAGAHPASKNYTDLRTWGRLFLVGTLDGGATESYPFDFPDRFADDSAPPVVSLAIQNSGDFGYALSAWIGDIDQRGGTLWVHNSGNDARALTVHMTAVHHG